MGAEVGLYSRWRGLEKGHRIRGGRKVWKKGLEEEVFKEGEPKEESRGRGLKGKGIKGGVLKDEYR